MNDNLSDPDKPLPFFDLLENLPYGIALLDHLGNELYFNPAFTAMTGYILADLPTVNDWAAKAYPDPVYRAEVMAAWESDAVNGGNIANATPVFKVTCKDGTTKDICFNAAFLQNGLALVTMLDVTRQKQAETALRLSEARYRAIVEDQTDLICRFTPDGRLTFVNGAYCRYFGQTGDTLLGQQFFPEVAAAERETIRQGILSLSPDKPVFKHEQRLPLAEGTSAWHHWTFRAIFDDHGKLTECQAVGYDITERKQAETQLRFLSLHDPLTGLYNRTYFEQILGRLETKPFQAISIVIFDVDGLKLINDTLGHTAGDALLTTASTIIKAPFRQNDIVARIGGDEFAVLITGEQPVDIEKIINCIRKKIGQYNQGSPDLPLSLSIGFATRTSSLVTMTEIFREADNIMYREKLHRSQSTRSAIVQTLMRALEARDFITEGHATRLQGLVIDLSRALGLTKRHIADLRLLAQFHDIGKVGIPDRILFKPGPLTPLERTEMQRHSEIGHRIALAAPDLAHIADWIYKHHERWDGSGYPLGLKGPEIPLECRIIAIADAYDVMTSDRPYHQAITPTAAVAELRRCAGTQFDPH
ncbi:MAG: diguanylate cyclase, partial [Heliobacteriaceae bacterium]|nr:diguanylate cyclase [Heliobacteriaceae bacterium]